MATGTEFGTMRDWHWVETENPQGDPFAGWCFASAPLADRFARNMAGPTGRVVVCEVREIPEHARVNGWRDDDPPRCYQG